MTERVDAFIDQHRLKWKENSFLVYTGSFFREFKIKALDQILSTRF
jgi:hypothetical protein